MRPVQRRDSWTACSTTSVIVLACHPGVSDGSRSFGDGPGPPSAGDGEHPPAPSIVRATDVAPAANRAIFGRKFRDRAQESRCRFGRLGS